jgi:hypothetical protein
MKQALLTVSVVAVYVVHQDVWFWRTVEPLAFGFIPIGLFYHACFCVGASALMWALVRHAWPSHLEGQLAVADRSVERQVGGTSADAVPSPSNPEDAAR